MLFTSNPEVQSLEVLGYQRVSILGVKLGTTLLGEMEAISFTCAPKLLKPGWGPPLPTPPPRPRGHPGHTSTFVLYAGVIGSA